MNQTAYQELHRCILGPDLNVRSGAYTAIDPDLRAVLGARGEFEYPGLTPEYEGPANDLLAVSAFAPGNPDEAVLARRIFPNVSREHPVIGRYSGLYAGWAIEGFYRDHGSSGGLATWLLAELLKRGEIDGVVNLQARHRTSPEEPLFEYRIATTVNEVQEGAKSKYFPGELGSSLEAIAKLDGRFAVTAIPSIAYELRLLQRTRPEYRDKIAYIVGLICGHQKTARYADYLASQMGFDPANVETINFRKKVPGRRSSDYATEIVGIVDGTRITRTRLQTELDGTDWGLGYFKANFSDLTEDAFNETADIVFGDAWLPQYTEEWRGTNVVITRNPELNSILQKAAGSGRIYLEDVDESTILASQASLVRHCVTEIHIRRKLMGGGESPTASTPSSNDGLFRSQSYSGMQTHAIARVSRGLDPGRESRGISDSNGCVRGTLSTRSACGEASAGSNTPVGHASPNCSQIARSTPSQLVEASDKDATSLPRISSCGMTTACSGITFVSRIHSATTKAMRLGAV